MVDCTTHTPRSGILLAADGGGSHTSVWAGPRDDPGQVRLEGEGSNATTAGVEAATTVLTALFNTALLRMGATQRDVGACVVGLAGSEAVEIREAVLQRLADYLPGARIEVRTDIELVMTAGLGDGPGLAIVSGTGSIALARGTRQPLVRAGGWGPAFGDPGSGYAIGHGALRSVIRASDGLEPNGPLVETVLQALGMTAAADLRHHPPRVKVVADLARAVVRCAEAGDETAAGLLADAGRDLAALCIAAAARAGIADAAVRVALGGGVLVHVPQVRLALLRDLARASIEIDSVVLVSEPVAAAAALAAALVPGGGAGEPA